MRKNVCKLFILSALFFGAGCSFPFSADQDAPAVAAASVGTPSGPGFETLLGVPKVFDPQKSADGRTSILLEGQNIKVTSDGESRLVKIEEPCPEPPSEMDRNVWLRPGGGFVYGEYCLAESATIISRLDESGKTIGSKSFPGGIGLDVSPISGKAVFYVGSTEEFALVVTGLDGSDPSILLTIPNPNDGSGNSMIPGIVRFSANGKKLFYIYGLRVENVNQEGIPKRSYDYHFAVHDFARGTSKNLDYLFPENSDSVFYGWIGDSVVVAKDKSGVATRHVLD